MATNDLSGFKLPDITQVGVPQDVNVTGSPTYANIMKTIQSTSALPTMTKSVLPSIAGILSPEGQGVSPYARAIKDMTNTNVADVQTDMMKRGLTGSDIEAVGMGQARAAGEQNLANLYGQTATQLSNMIWQAATGDINQNRELLLTLAQAMGQELSSEREMAMFQQALQASIDQANATRRSKQKTAIGSAIGGAGGALLGSFIPGVGPAMGLQLGSGLGGAIGGNQ